MKQVIVAALLVPAAALAGPWGYQTDTDKMTSKQVKFASIDSDNSLDLRFPYGGA